MQYLTHDTNKHQNTMMSVNLAAKSVILCLKQYFSVSVINKIAVELTFIPIINMLCIKWLKCQ